jgi:hypothetical protein
MYVPVITATLRLMPDSEQDQHESYARNLASTSRLMVLRKRDWHKLLVSRPRSCCRIIARVADRGSYQKRGSELLTRERPCVLFARLLGTWLGQGPGDGDSGTSAERSANATL